MRECGHFKTPKNRMSNNRVGGAREPGGRKVRGTARNEIKPGADDLNLRCLTNDILDVRLASLAAWREANEIFLWDRGGPYIVTQEGYDPDDLTMTRAEFVLGRAGKWLALEIFFRLPLAERWQGFVFATATEALRVMRDLPLRAVTWNPTPNALADFASIQGDAMADAYRSGKKDLCRAAQ